MRDPWLRAMLVQMPDIYKIETATTAVVADIVATEVSERSEAKLGSSPSISEGASSGYLSDVAAGPSWACVYCKTANSPARATCGACKQEKYVAPPPRAAAVASFSPVRKPELKASNLVHQRPK